MLMKKERTIQSDRLLNGAASGTVAQRCRNTKLMKAVTQALLSSMLGILAQWLLLVKYCG